MSLLPYKSSGWNTHREVKLREIDYPLGEGEPAHYTVKRTYEGPSSTYASLALDTADTEFSAAKFVRQGPRVDCGAGCIRYDRLFATVPAQWSDPEDYPFTFPAFTGANTFGTTYAISGAATSTGTVIVTHATSSGIAAGDAVYISLNYTRGGIKYSQTFSAVAVATTNTNQTTVPGVLQNSGTISAVSGFVAKSLPARPNVLDVIADSRIVRDYVLSSTASIATDLPLSQLFSAVDNTGAKTTTLTATTVPTSAIYAALVTSASEIVVGCTRKRYLGNIYCRETRLVPAQ